MNLSPTTPAVDFTTIRNVPAYYCVQYEAATLARKRTAYASLRERYERLLLMHEEGITVTVTMTSRSGTMKVEADDQFEPMEYLNSLSSQLDQLAKEILALHEKQQTTGLDNGRGEVEDDLVRHQALALLLPPTTTLADAQPSPPAAAKAA